MIRLARTRSYERLTALADLHLPAGSKWSLTRQAKQGDMAGEMLARQANVTMDFGRPFVDRLVYEGMMVRSDGTLELTDAGRQATGNLFAARCQGLRELLADWPPEKYAELSDLIIKLSLVLLGEDADRHFIKEPASAAETDQDRAVGRRYLYTVK